jgi:hypothetical protein
MHSNSTKKLSFLFLIFLFFVTSLSIASSITKAQSIPSVNSIAAALERRYHLNLRSIQNQGEYFNVSDQKKRSPEVLLFFSPADPKPGQEITATAYPSFFENQNPDLYYTWYIKRPDCELGTSDSTAIDNCDWDNDGNITVEDWKIEATRLNVNRTLDVSRIDYSTDNDNDGYKATFGGHGREDIPDRCYIMDQKTGIQHEIVGSSSGNSSGGYNTPSCPSGYDLRCVEDTTKGCCDNSPCTIGNISNNQTVCEEVSGLTPYCDGSGRAQCSYGEARCVPESYTAPGDFSMCPSDLDENSCDEISTQTPSCDSSGGGGGRSLCSHLFPSAPGETTGDNKFLVGEEEFWGTNPQDPDTQNTGYGDESNVVGRGMTKFTWNYQVGDQVGVAVEGTSQIPTKHDERSKMIMWALPKNDCDPKGKGVYIKRIKGYDVPIPTTTTDINTCLKDNLVDPREGNQENSIDVDLDYLPEEPVNDSSGNAYGDTLYINSSLANSEDEEGSVLYDWDVYISSDGSYNPREYTREDGDENTSSWVDITDELVEANLITLVYGNAISELQMELNLTEDFLSKEGLSLNQVFPEGIGHLRIRLNVKEQFLQTGHREGTATLIIKITNNGSRITPYVMTDVTDDQKFSLSNGSVICEENNAITRGICYIIKNEVIGLEIEDDRIDSNADSFSWTLNEKPLLCDKKISNECEDDRQTNINFFPVDKDPGERYVVKVKVLETEKKQIQTFTRVFEVVDPFVEIISADLDTVWPKYLGYYKDTDGDTYDNISTEILQGYSQSLAQIQTLFFPSFIKDSPLTTKYWKIRAPLTEEVEGGILQFPILKPPGSAYFMEMKAIYQQNSDVREAMKQLWNLNITETANYWLEKSVQLEVVMEEGEPDEGDISLASPQEFFASVITHIPSYLWMLLQTVLSMGVILFGLSLAYSISGSRK